MHQADIVCGYRAERQDNAARRLNAWGWNALIRLLFGYLCRDIDCGFKLFRREVLGRVPLESDGAMIDTELSAGAKAQGYRIAEVPVTQLPRVGGEATGANPKVIVRAFRDLARFRLRLTSGRTGPFALGPDRSSSRSSLVRAITLGGVRPRPRVRQARKRAG